MTRPSISPYMAQKQPQKFNAIQIIKELGEESKQIKYWTSRLEEEGQNLTTEAETAVSLNLARIANIFSNPSYWILPWDKYPCLC